LRAFDGALRVAGAVLSVLLGAGSALLEVFLTPLVWPVPVAAAVLGNLVLAWFAWSTVDRVWAWLLAAVPWFGVMVVAVGSTSEGDQLANSWTGLGTFAAGTAAFFVPAALPRWSP
jgi:hypothetical protein